MPCFLSVTLRHNEDDDSALFWQRPLPQHLQELPDVIACQLQVKLKNAQIQGQIAQAQHPVPPREQRKPSPVKMRGVVVNGVNRAAAMLFFGPEAVLAGQVLAKLGICIASAVLGAEAVNASFERIW